MESPSRVATTSAGLAGVGVLASAIGPGGAMAGVLSPLAGFGLLALGLLLGLLAVVTGLIGLWTTRAAAPRGGRSRALAGIGVGLVLVIGIAAMRGETDRRADFNDIATDLDNPPAFSQGTIEANHGRDLSYPTEFAAKQRALYPDLASIPFNEAPDKAYAAALAAAKSLGWAITYSEEPGHIEATDTSQVFRFVDDVVIRIRPGLTGATIDVRSKSRDGRGDLGVNANRIRAFHQALKGGS